jgi:hypothetical protein
MRNEIRGFESTMSRPPSKPPKLTIFPLFFGGRAGRSDAVTDAVERGFGSMRLVRGSRAPWFHVHILAAVPIAQSWRCRVLD